MFNAKFLYLSKYYYRTHLPVKNVNLSGFSVHLIIIYKVVQLLFPLQYQFLYISLKNVLTQLLHLKASFLRVVHYIYFKKFILLTSTIWLFFPLWAIFLYLFFSILLYLCTCEMSFKDCVKKLISFRFNWLMSSIVTIFLSKHKFI